jgi:hypothetical protein
MLCYTNRVVKKGAGSDAMPDGVGTCQQPIAGEVEWTPILDLSLFWRCGFVITSYEI